MGNPTKKEEDFSAILDQGAAVDDIFKDNRPPFGADPYAPREPIPEPAGPSESRPEIPELENENVFAIHRKYAAMEKMFQLLNKEMTFGELASEITRIAMEQLHSEAGSLFEVDYANGCLFFRAVSGRSAQSLLKVTIPMSAGIVGHVCETQKPVVLSELEDSSMHLKSIGSLVGFVTSDVIACPIVIRGTSFGCIEVLNCIGADRYSQLDKEVLQTIAECAAKIIENRLMMAAFSKELESYRVKKAA